MADVKVSGLPNKSTPAANDYVVLNDASGPTTKRSLLSALATFFFNQVNIPDGTGSPRTRMTEQMYDFVASGLVWTGDSYASTRNASMTSGVVYINGRRISISAVVARAFTASKDTYIDILDNADGTGTLVYTEVTNNAASPSLAANSLRIGIVVTGASNIANVGSINQGQEGKLLPVASSVYYQVCDSLGNLICPRDPDHLILGMRSLYSTAGVASATAAQVTGLSIPIKIPGSIPRKIEITLDVSCVYNLTSGGQTRLVIYDGTVGSGTLLGLSINVGASAGVVTVGGNVIRVTTTLAAGDHTLNLGLRNNGTGTATIEAGTLDLTAFVMPSQFAARLVG